MPGDNMLAAGAGLRRTASSTAWWWTASRQGWHRCDGDTRHVCVVGAGAVLRGEGAGSQ